MVRRSLFKLYESRKSNLDYRVNRDFIRNGIATIPCRITDYHDVISKYSVKGYETLNPEFIEYVKSTACVTPPECPLVLNIIGDCLTDEEKQTIQFIVQDDFAYDLGMVEKEEKRHFRIFAFVLIGLAVSGALLYLTNALAEVPRELFFILFWFMGDTLCDYIFFTGRDLRLGRRTAGRLASVKVVFSENEDAPHYTESDLNSLYSEIEKDINETRQ